MLPSRLSSLSLRASRSLPAPTAPTALAARRAFSQLSKPAAPTPTSHSHSRSYSVRSLALAALASSAVAAAAVLSAGEQGLSDKEFRPFKVKSVREYNHNSKLIQVDLGSTDVDFPVSSFVLTKYAGADGKDVIRPYTPVDPDELARGTLTLLVKAYPEGKMSRHLCDLRAGDTVEMKGPIAKLKYAENKYKNVGMIAGGTGITPMLQVIEKIVRNPRDRTRITLLFANQGPRDVLLKEELDSLARRHGDRFRVIYTVDKAESGWKGETGYVNEEMIRKYLPAPGADSFIYVCGPPGQMAAISGPKAKDFSQGELDGALKKLGYEKDHVFKF